MWIGVEDDSRRDWDTAVKHCDTLKLAGYQDWRLPEKDELVGLLRDIRRLEHKEILANLAMRKSQYWTGTQVSVFSSVAWYVDFYRGDTGTYHKQVKFFNRCVRNIKAVNSKSN